MDDYRRGWERLPEGPLPESAPDYTPTTEDVRESWRAFLYALAGNAERDARLSELAVVGDVDELLALAVEAGKLGLRQEDLAPMARSWHVSAIKMRALADMAERYADEIDGNRP